MKDVICLGDMCPIPLIKLKQCKELKNKGESIKLGTDHSCSVESITDFCHKNLIRIDKSTEVLGITSWNHAIQINLRSISLYR